VRSVIIRQRGSAEATLSVLFLHTAAEAGGLLRDLYSPPSIIRIIESWRMRWAGHVTRMGRKGTRIGYW
jgi:hypothetical protein